MRSLLIVGGRVLDPANRVDTIADLLVLDGHIAGIGSEVSDRAPADVPRLNASGKIVCPGFIDGHVHLREPGQSAKETIASGTASAARGGFTTVVCMPNTDPPIDNPGTVALIREKAVREALVNVFVTGAISRGLAGQELAPVGLLAQAGVVAVTDDGHCVQNNELMRRVLEYAAMFQLPVMDHCQDYSLVTDGVMHEGLWSTVLGLRGWPAAGEELIVARNIQLVELTGAQLHCQHISSGESVRLLREARQRGLPISGEACPHHFVLTDAAVAGSAKFWPGDGKSISANWKDGEFPYWPSYDARLKVNPPLRSADHRDCVIEGVVDGTLEMIASDHAPHCGYEKEVEFDYAPFGITGLETELALSLMVFYHTGRLSLLDLIRRFTTGPAGVLRLQKGTLSQGADGDVTVIDPDREWKFQPESTASRSINNPFYGWPLKGRAVATIVAGKPVWMDSSVVGR